MIVTIDLETLYSSEYSLSKMSEVDYIRSPLFQVIMCAVKINNDPAEMYIGYDRVAKRLHQIDWSRAALLSHNIRFDGAIAAWHFGIKPKLYLCTLSMARALIHIAAGGSSLAKVSKYLGLPDKGDEVVRAMGKRLQDFTRVELRAYADYCLRDAENCKAAFDLFRPRFATSELAVVDQFARMFIEPEVMLDRAVLSEHLAALQAAREALFASAAHIERPVFSSNVKFAALLESMGVEVPTKMSPTTGHEIPALSRSDRGFKELVDDATQPPAVQAVLAVRIGAKATAEETRTQTLLNLSRHSWAGPGGNIQGLCPVPLKYWGAHTGRASGDGGFNFLNLQRGSPLRRAIRALPGMRIVHRDSSQIEARMVAWMARCSDLLEAFAQGRDVYSEFASKIYRRRITKADKLERFVGKTGILGLGYGCGPARFRAMLFIGNGGVSVIMDERDATSTVYLYRREYDEIPSLWNVAGEMLQRMIYAARPVRPDEDFDFRRVTTSHAAGLPSQLRAVDWTAEALWLPSGMAVQYPNLRTERVNHPDGRITIEQFYDGGPGRGAVRIYGAKVVENLCQALARIVITDIGSRVYHATGYKPFLNTYDSLDFAVPEGAAPAMDRLLEAEFAIPPGWAYDLPLASEGGWGFTLADAERGVNQ